MITLTAFDIISLRIRQKSFINTKEEKLPSNLMDTASYIQSYNSTTCQVWDVYVRIVPNIEEHIDQISYVKIKRN